MFLFPEMRAGHRKEPQGKLHTWSGGSEKEKARQEVSCVGSAGWSHVGGM